MENSDTTKFKLKSKYKPTGDQPNAIKEILKGLEENKKHQVLLGATGTGKTFTMANVIVKSNRQTLVLAHNKTLALQLYTELKGFFPNNRVEYFVSYFDFYQPEAYLPKSDTYIDKSTKNNAEIEMLRLSTLNALITRNDVIVVATVASIYPEFNPVLYKQFFYEIMVGQQVSRRDLLLTLVRAGYKRNDIELQSGCFSVKGDVIKIAPSWTMEYYIRIDMFGDEISGIASIDVLTANVKNRFNTYTIFPAEDYLTSPDRLEETLRRIRTEKEERVAWFKEHEKPLEAERLNQRTTQDLEMLAEFGTCSGVENYSAQLEWRDKGQRPYTLLDFFKDDFLTIIDESHMMIPQLHAMFNTDRSRKTTLVEYGFRLPSALDNRPLKFDEFMEQQHNIIYTSATPGKYELAETKNKVIQQIVRPTGLLDPTIEIKPSTNQIEDMIEQILIRKSRNERVFITTLTIAMSEDLTNYLQDRNLKVAYLHNELKTFERTQVLINLRRGVFDVVVGINLLREGLDIPEVSLICILDADKQGFFRSETALIQIIGRAARNSEGHVIMYADNISPAMEKAINETDRRRNIQKAYNKAHGIIPQTIIKAIQEPITTSKTSNDIAKLRKKRGKARVSATQKLINELREDMLQAAQKLDYEKAAELRDVLMDLEAGNI